MSDSTGRWSVGRLALSWIVYWAGAAAIQLGPAIAAGWRAANGPEGQGNISLGFNGAHLTASVTELGSTAWSGSISVFALAVWIAIPPLALWAIWLVRNARQQSAEPHLPVLADGAAADIELRAGQSANAGRDRA